MYGQKDVEKLVDVFSEVRKIWDDKEQVLQELEKIIEYPVPVIQEFMKCMEAFSEQDETFLKNNYEGVIGYIAIRMNLADMDPINKTNISDI